MPNPNHNSKQVEHDDEEGIDEEVRAERHRVAAATVETHAVVVSNVKKNFPAYKYMCCRDSAKDSLAVKAES